MTRPLSGLEGFLEWQDRLTRYESSGLSVDAFCEQEEIRRSKFVAWLLILKQSPPQPLSMDREGRGESAGEPVFVPVSVKGGSVEIELPNGSLVRLPADMDHAVLMDIVHVVGALPQGSPG